MSVRMDRCSLNRRHSWNGHVCVIPSYDPCEIGTDMVFSLRRRLLALVLVTVWVGELVAFVDIATGEKQYQLHYADRPANTSTNRVYSFAVHPLHNPMRLFSKYQPLLDLINEQVEGFSLKLVTSRDYPTYDQRLYMGRFHFALPNPLQTLASQSHGYHIIGKMGDDHIFRGIIVMRRDSHVMFVEDLDHAALSFPAPTALAATIMPKYFLQTRGLNLENNDIRYVGSQESAIMNVYMGKTAAAGTWPLPWELLLSSRPELSEVLEVKWMTPSLVNNGLVVRNDVPADHVQQVMKVLLDLPTYSRGREILDRIHISCFETASSISYEPVREFLSDYYRLFPNEQPIQGKSR